MISAKLRTLFLIDSFGKSVAHRPLFADYLGSGEVQFVPDPTGEVKHNIFTLTAKGEEYVKQNATEIRPGVYALTGEQQS